MLLVPPHTSLAYNTSKPEGNSKSLVSKPHFTQEVMRIGIKQVEATCCSVAKSCLMLCGPMDRSTPGLPVFHYLPEFTQTHVHWVGDAIQPSRPLLSPQSFPASGSFPMSQLFTSGGQCFGVSASASVLPMNVLGWLPLGWTGLIS